MPQSNRAEFTENLQIQLQEELKGASKEQNYQRLIMDTYNSVKFLNTLDLGFLETSLSIFRKNIFDNKSDIPKLIADALRENQEGNEMIIG